MWEIEFQGFLYNLNNSVSVVVRGNDNGEPSLLADIEYINAFFRRHFLSLTTSMT